MEKIEKCSIVDLPVILELQKICFMQNAAFHNNYQIQPLLQTLKEVEEELNQGTILKYSINNNITGSVRAFQKQDTCFIGKLIVHPDFQNKGIGSKLLLAIENAFLHVKKYALFTAEEMEKNLYLYRKYGYRIVRTEEHDGIRFAFMEKPGGIS